MRLNSQAASTRYVPTPSHIKEAAPKNLIHSTVVYNFVRDAVVRYTSRSDVCERSSMEAVAICSESPASEGRKDVASQFQVFYRDTTSMRDGGHNHVCTPVY
jgi:hypothetical protein